LGFKEDDDWYWDFREGAGLEPEDDLCLCRCLPHIGVLLPDGVLRPQGVLLLVFCSCSSSCISGGGTRNSSASMSDSGESSLKSSSTDGVAAVSGLDIRIFLVKAGFQS